MDNADAECELCGSTEGCERRADSCVTCAVCARPPNAIDEPDEENEENEDEENEEPLQNNSAAQPTPSSGRRKQRQQASRVLDCSRRRGPRSCSRSHPRHCHSMACPPRPRPGSACRGLKEALRGCSTQRDRASAEPEKERSIRRARALQGSCSSAGGAQASGQPCR